MNKIMNKKLILKLIYKVIIKDVDSCEMLYMWKGDW